MLEKMVIEVGLFSTSFHHCFFHFVRLKLPPPTCKNHCFFISFLMFLRFRLDASITTSASKKASNLAPFSYEKSVKMASKIDHPTWIDSHVGFPSTLKLFGGHFWTILGSEIGSKSMRHRSWRRLCPQMALQMLSRLLLDRLGTAWGPLGDHLGTIWGPGPSPRKALCIFIRGPCSIRTSQSPAYSHS